MVLSDMGAEVIKIEDPNLGDYLRTTPPVVHGLGGRFLAVSRDKRSLALDLKKPGASEVFLRLVDHADVVVETFRPGVLDKLGVGWTALSARRPGIILCSISGYGQDGPYRDRAGHDLNYIGLAGALAMNGPRGGAPQVPGVQVADMAGGGLWGACGVLGALVGRAATGKGRHVDISMTEGAMALLCHEITNLPYQERSPTRGTETLNGGVARYGVYRTQCGGYLSVGSLEPKFYQAFSDAIGRAGDPMDVFATPEEQERIRADIQERVGQKTRAEWEAIFARVDACVEPVLELSELTAHPQHQARRALYTVEDPVFGAVTQVRTPVGEARGVRRAPYMGEHTVEVLAEAGFSAQEIADLKGRSVIAAR
jgi:crotonobetainyl-CoA:carnitine CoA-transferase CaiB-like acyl-CoA transferase